MSDEGETTLNVKGLDQLIKALKAKVPSTKVGILGQKSSRGISFPKNPKTKVQNLNNAEVGAFHEFGTSKTPQRSFLRVPISENLEKYMERAGFLSKDVFDATLKAGSIVPYMKKLAVLAEGIVKEAFDTAGFGKWKPSIMDQKKVKQTLVETQQLRNSITSEVKE
jgi:hypothetical protein